MFIDKKNGYMTFLVIVTIYGVTDSVQDEQKACMIQS